MPGFCFQVSGFRDWGSGFRVSGLRRDIREYRGSVEIPGVHALFEIWVSGAIFPVHGLGFSFNSGFGFSDFG